MRKILAILLAVMIIGSAAGLLSAAPVYYGEPMQSVKTYTVALTAGKTLSSSVTTQNRVLGFTFSDSAAGAGAVMDNVDAATAGDSTVFGEVYVASGTAETVMFPFPRKITSGLVVMSTNATGTITVYYL